MTPDSVGVFSTVTEGDRVEVPISILIVLNEVDIGDNQVKCVPNSLMKCQNQSTPIAGIMDLDIGNDGPVRNRGAVRKVIARVPAKNLPHGANRTDYRMWPIIIEELVIVRGGWISPSGMV